MVEFMSGFEGNTILDYVTMFLFAAIPVALIRGWWREAKNRKKK